MSKRTQTMVQLTDELLALLDERAAGSGVSRSQLIRDAIAAFLAEDRASQIDRQIVEGYRRKPQSGDYDTDEWGSLAAAMTTLTADQMRRLNQEERSAGFPPW